MSAKQGIGVGYLGLGAFLPEEVRTNDFWGPEWRERHAARAVTDLGGMVDNAANAPPEVRDVDPEVVRHAGRYRHDLFRGAKERRVMSDDMESSDMEAVACRDALRHAGVAADDIELLIEYTQLPDRAPIANHGAVARKVGLPKHLLAFTVDAGCASFLPQTILGARLLQAGEARHALLSVGAPISRLTDYDTPSSVFPGDGAVAAVMGTVEDGLGYVAQATLTRGDLHEGILIVDRAQPHLRPQETARMTDDLTIQTVDREATRHMGTRAASLCREACHRVLSQAGYTPEDVDFFVCAQSTAWFGAAQAEAAGVPEGRYLEPEDHFQQFGHLLPGSMPLNLLLAYRLGRLKKGDLVLMYSPGVGFSQVASLYRWNLEAPAT